MQVPWWFPRTEKRPPVPTPAPATTLVPFTYGGITTLRAAPIKSSWRSRVR